MDARTAAQRRAHVQLLDVREHNEWLFGHIEGATHVPMAEVPARLGELDPARPVVVVCRSGNRSALVTRFLAAQGLDAHNLDGGVKAWVRAGEALTTPDGAPGRIA